MRIEEADWRRITICLSGNRKSGMRDVSSCKTLFSLLLSENVYLLVLTKSILSIFWEENHTDLNE